MSNFFKYKNYLATINFSVDDDVFYGNVVGIDDVITFEGKSVKEVKHAFHQAVDDYLATCLALNKKPEKPHKETLYLLKSPVNAKRLLDSLKEYEKGLGQERNLIEER
ncbi:MAG: hypothetical protein V5804_16575 [Mucilaginibacter sp.]|uniref:hypothetical protein n=1 Tax=Mucilaginibacter sp. TaxID=1882438 RepID=UPI0034E51051